jgi:hypothetical protein
MGLRTRLFRAMGFEPVRPRVRAYSGARVSRLTADWVTSGTSADSEIKSSFKALRNRARQLCRDNDYARQALRSDPEQCDRARHQASITGADAAWRQVGCGDQRPDPSGMGAVEHKSRCDVSGLLGFHDMERLLCRSLAESGRGVCADDPPAVWWFARAVCAAGA